MAAFALPEIRPVFAWGYPNDGRSSTPLGRPAIQSSPEPSRLESVWTPQGKGRLTRLPPLRCQLWMGSLGGLLFCPADDKSRVITVPLRVSDPLERLPELQRQLGSLGWG